MRGPLAVDATVVSSLKAAGEPRPRADKRAGLALRTAASTERRYYEELVDSPVLRLVAAVTETGGRLSAEAQALLAAAAELRTQNAERSRASSQSSRASTESTVGKPSFSCAASRFRVHTRERRHGLPDWR